MCTSGSHFVIEGNCLCGAIQNGEYDEKRDFLKDIDKYLPTLKKEKKDV